eukprot:272346_1
MASEKDLNIKYIVMYIIIYICMFRLIFAAAAECGYYALQYSYSGSITWDELKVKCSTAAKAHTSGFICSMILGGIGFALGGPMGVAIGATIGGIVSDIGMRKYCDSDKIEEYKKTKEQLICALKKFDYNDELDELLKDKEKFNVEELKRRYHLRAVWNQADVLRRQGGYTDDEIQKKWSDFYSKYILLLNICKQRDNQQ